MFEHIFAGPNLPFAVALLLMLGIGLLEGIAVLIGGGLSGLVDGSLPELGGDVDPGASLEGASSGSLLAGALSWLHVGRVPFLILLLFFLMCFGLTGLLVQGVSVHLLGRMLPPALAAFGVLPFALVGVRGFGSVFARVFPSAETTALPRSAFVGSIAYIVTGTASRGCPAQAKLRDRHGQTHYVMVEPDTDGERFETGTSVILVEQHGAFFQATRNPLPELAD